jgi:dephospho-CoA kinase
MLRLKRVAITGGIASGKSTVIEVFQKLGAYVVSADQITHQLLSSNTELIKQVISLLGNETLSDGCIDRKKVAKKVFNDPELLRKLEALIHPNVASEIVRLWNEVGKSQKYPLFVAEVPLLFEAGQDGWYDATCAVIAPDSFCKKRFCHASGYDEGEYQRRASRQLTQAEKAKKAHFVIENIGSLDELKSKATTLYKQLTTGDNA